MPPDEFFYLGKVLKRHGTKGDLLVFLDVDDPFRYRNLTSVYVASQHERIPYFIESIDIREKGKAIVRFEGIGQGESAGALCGKELYLPVSQLPTLTGNRFYYHEIIGFQVVDEEYGPVGPVERVMELPQQDLLCIDAKGQEVLIPVVDEIILKVDRIGRILHIHAPEGLIALYLT